MRLSGDFRKQIQHILVKEFSRRFFLLLSGSRMDCMRRLGRKCDEGCFRRRVIIRPLLNMFIDVKGPTSLENVNYPISNFSNIA